MDRAPYPHFVYMVRNMVNGKFYIGFTSRPLLRRLREHFNAAERIAINGAFSRAIRKYGRDAFWISAIKKVDGRDLAISEEIRLIALLRPHYNSTLGGEGQLGRRMSAATREKISKSKIGKRYPGRRRHKWDQERRARHSAPTSERWKKYAFLGPAARARSVVCLDDGRRFPSIVAAAREYGVAKSALTELCLGKRGRKTVGGLRFRYEVP